jgi:transposase
MVVVIPTKSNRKEQRYHCKGLYRKRHKVENAFLKMKQWRGVATRYCKRSSSFEAVVQICCLMMWLSSGRGMDV